MPVCLCVPVHLHEPIQPDQPSPLNVVKCDSASGELAPLAYVSIMPVRVEQGSKQRWVAGDARTKGLACLKSCACVKEWGLSSDG